jgi:non-ribosomal peptide synthetase component E (peptide arylation enzyme)
MRMKKEWRWKQKVSLWLKGLGFSQDIIRPMRKTEGYLRGTVFFVQETWERSSIKKVIWRITGRKKDIIIRGAENISATEVEELILTHSSVEDTAVVGMPDPYFGGRKACAYVKLAKGKALSFNELISHLKQKGASVLLLPERLEIVEELPLTNVGKVDKKACVNGSEQN